MFSKSVRPSLPSQEMTPETTAKTTNCNGRLLNGIGAPFFGRFMSRYLANVNIKFLGVAGGLILALLLAPATNRLFLSQAILTAPLPIPGLMAASVVASQLGSKEGPLSGKDDPFDQSTVVAAHKAAAQYPQDMQIQLANASTLSPGIDLKSQQIVQNLRCLESNPGCFNQPALYANMIRYATLGGIRVQHADAQAEITGQPLPDHTKQKVEPPIDSEAYAFYSLDCASGESLDPDNAYFPFMRAVGLFGEGKDAQALAAIHRAAQKTVWREYYNDELQGRWKLQDAASINNSALFHSLSAASLLFPHYAPLRGAARVTIFKAMQAEQAGRTAEGMQLREDIVRLGSLLHTRSSNLIAALAGSALTEVALARPGGASAFKWSSPHKGGNKARQRAEFDLYLKRTGQTHALSTFHTAQQADDDMDALVKNTNLSALFDGPLHDLMIWWLLDLLALSSILWVLLGGGLGALCTHSPRIQDGKALPRDLQLIIPLGLIGGLLFAPLFFSGTLFGYMQQVITGEIWALMQITLALIALALLILLALPATSLQNRLYRAAACATSGFVGIALVGFYCWQSRGLTAILSLMQVYTNLAWAEGNFPSINWTQCLPAMALAVPLLLVGLIGLVSVVCRVPLTVGLARGLRGLALPVASCLLLVYGVMLLCTVRAESAVQYGLDRMSENEIQYLAELSHSMRPRPDTTAKKSAP